MATIEQDKIVKGIFRINDNLNHKYSAEFARDELWFKNELIMIDELSPEWKMVSSSMSDVDLAHIIKLKEIFGGVGDIINEPINEDTIKYSPENGWGFDE